MKNINYVAILILTLGMFEVQSLPIESKKLLTSPRNEMIRISPDGKFISGYYRGKKDHALSFINRETNTFDMTVVIGNDNRVDDYYWLNSKQLFIEVSNRNGDYELIGDIVDGKVKLRLVNAKGYLVHMLPDKPNHVLYAKRWSSNSRFHDLYIVDIETLIKGDFSDIDEVDISTSNATSFFYDEKMELVITSEYDSDDEKVTVKYVPLNGGKWKTLFEVKNADYYYEPLGFIDEKNLAILTNKDTDKIVLRGFNIDTQKLGEIIYQHPNFDLINAGFTEQGALNFVSYREHGIRQTTYFDQGNQDFINRLKNTFANQEAYFIDVSDDKQYAILHVNGSDQPGEYFVYDEKKDRVNRLLLSYPDLEGTKFSASQQLKVKAKDGTVLEAFLNVPTGIDHSTLLVMPHGGPISVQETDRFNKDVQYFVSRGFSVLRVNFRGSGGFGKAFAEKGVGEFGKLIEEDITAAVEQVTQLRKFKNICSMGASYGGYSAAILAIKHPDTYQCVVSAYGVFDLKLAFNASNIKVTEEYQEAIANTIGEYRDSFIDVSPVYLHKSLKAPILLIAGREDDRADFEHSNRFNYLLKKNGHPVESLFYRDTGHGQSTWAGTRHESAYIYDYLMRTLKLSYPASDEISASAKKAIADDFAFIADKFSFEDSVDNDEAKSFQYYLKAAEYDHPRSTFNIGANYHSGTEVDKDYDEALEYYRKAASLNHDRAHGRLGRMYMEAEYVAQDWSKANEHLNKAFDLDATPFNIIRLARFLCMAPAEYRDFDRCLNLMNLEQYYKHSKSWGDQAKSLIKENLSWIIAEGELSPQELKRIGEFTLKTLELTELEVVIENQKDGLFKYKEGERFGQEGEYELISSSRVINSQQGEGDFRFGLTFETDISGVNRYSDQVALVVRWRHRDKNGAVDYHNSTVLHGSPKNKWSMRRKLTEGDSAGSWTLEVFDFKQNKLYEKEFKIDIESPKLTTKAPLVLN